MSTNSQRSNLAFVFPGQGSQSVGMLSELGKHFPVVEQTFDEASGVLGFDLWELVQQGPEVTLNGTDKTQPAMLAAGVAVWRVWQVRHGAQPAMLAGHSLGEYSALVCAGAIDFRDAVGLVSDRGLFMQQAVPAGTGAMAALLGLDNDKVIAACNEAAQGEIVAAVNLNAPGQVVIAGHATAVARAAELAKLAGAKRVVTLPVSVPSHCALMKPAAEKLAERLGEIAIHRPATPVLNNVDVTACDDPAAIRDALKRQLFRPVRWVETIERFGAEGIDTIIECGPGKVLVGLNKRINKSMHALPVFDSETLDQALAALQD